MGDVRNTYGILMGKPVAKHPLGWPKRQREDDVKIDLR
jgi:hypothetical protein